jgi:ankyrin repeat protein
MVKLLLEKGADVNAQGGIYGNALHAAAGNGKRAVVKLLLNEGADVDSQGEMYGFALYAAAESSDYETVEMLLKKGANINAQGGYYGYALQAAAACGRDKDVELLLLQGADSNAQGGYFGNALQTAAMLGRNDIVKSLLKQGADVNAQGGPCGNALCAAVIESQAAAVRTLLQNGADVNSKIEIYGNALQAAMMERHEGIAELLVEAGADTNPPESTVNAWLQTALTPQTEGQFLETLLKQRLHLGADTQEISRRFLERGIRTTLYKKTMELLFNGELEANNQWIYDFSCWLAMTDDKFDDAARLVEKGANPNSYFKGQPTGLALAMYNGAEEAAAVLLDNGADINAPMFSTELKAKAQMPESRISQYLAWLVLGVFSTLFIILRIYCLEILYILVG